ncbi:MAG: 1-hydroxycarotenoid 3,4-desaturase CrtD, partial [Bacteroidota bacterium]
QLAGREPREHFRYAPLDVACHYFYPDGTQLKAFSEVEAFAAEVETVLDVDRAVIRDYLRDAARKYELTRGIFLERSLHKASTYLSKDVLRALANVWRLNLSGSMDRVNRRRLRHPKLVQLFNRFATYNGSSPYRAPGVMNLIPHLEHGIGAAFPEGGMHAITQSLVGLAEDLGVEFHMNTPVREIIVEGRRAVGIKLDSRSHRSDLVVSNMDVVPTYRHLLKGQKAPERVLRHERSSSALIYYWGIGAEFPEMGLHNIYFSADYKREFQEIFETKTVGEDPTIYVNITSKAQAGDAPEGMENWFVMVNVPCDTGQDWEGLIEGARERIIAKLSRMTGRDVASLIQTEARLDPRTIASRTSSFGGALYGASSNSKLSAFLRHPNFSGRIRDLYFCGGSVHPGGGIPLCLLSARIVAEMVGAA